MRRQLPRVMPRRTRARNHDLRARKVAPELAQPACGITRGGAACWAGHTCSSSPYASVMGCAPLPESSSTNSSRPTSPAAQRATSDVEAACIASHEVLQRRTVIDSLSSLKESLDQHACSREERGHAVRTSERDLAASGRHWQLQSMKYLFPGNCSIGRSWSHSLPQAPGGCHWASAARDGQRG